MTDTATGKPLRVTHMPRPELPPNPGVDIQKLQQVAAAETDSGVSSVTWSPGQRDLLFIFKGRLYSVLPNAEPRLLLTVANVTAVKSAPEGDQIAFVAGSERFVATIKEGTARARKLISVTKPQTAIEDFYWSRDGRSLAFIERTRAKCRFAESPIILAKKRSSGQ